MSLNEYLCKHFDQDDNGNIKLKTILHSEFIQLFIIAISLIYVISLIYSSPSLDKLTSNVIIGTIYWMFEIAPMNMIYVTIGLVIGWIITKYILFPLFKHILIPLFKIIVNIYIKFEHIYDKIKYKINNITVAKCKLKENKE